MKSLFYQVVRGDDIYFETDDKTEAESMFDDLVIWGWRGRPLPEDKLEMKVGYDGPPLGIREVRARFVHRLCAPRDLPAEVATIHREPLSPELEAVARAVG